MLTPDPRTRDGAYAMPIEGCIAAPMCCPICGAELRAGGRHTLYYQCGGKFWTRWDAAGIVGYHGRCGCDFEEESDGHE